MRESEIIPSKNQSLKVYPDYILPFASQFACEGSDQEFSKLQEHFLKEISFIKRKYEHVQPTDLCNQQLKDVQESQESPQQSFSEQQSSSQRIVHRKKYLKKGKQLLHYFCGKCSKQYSNACSLCFHIRSQHNNIVPENSIMKGKPFTLEESRKRNNNGKRGKRRMYRFIEEI